MVGKVIIIGLVVTVIGLIVFKAIDPNLDNNNNNSTNLKDNLNDDSTISIGISGEILRAGNYVLNEGSTMSDLIEEAGGVTNNADERCYFFDAVLENNESYYISPKYELDDVCGNNPIEKVNINKASKEELKDISGVGDTIALKIYNYRLDNGQFTTLEALKKVDGIGNATFAKMKNEIMLKDA